MTPTYPDRTALETAFHGSNVVESGGAGFIGSHLVDALVELGARIRVLWTAPPRRRPPLPRRPGGRW